MFSIKKAVLLAAMGAFAQGIAPDSARAEGSYRYNRDTVYQNTHYRVIRKSSYVRHHRAGRPVHVVRRVHQRRWHRHHRHWIPPRRYYRHYHWEPRWYYEPRHEYWYYRRDGGNNELFGTVIGAALGAVIGDSVSRGHGKGAVIVGGAVVGGFIGNRIGRSMDESDHHHATVVLETARTGHPVEWTNPDNGRRYTVTPTRTYRNAAGEDCRDYTVWGWIDGYEEKLHGTACRTADGAWRTVT